MKNFFLLTVAFSLLCACGGEEPVVKRPSYDPLVSLVESATSLESLAVVALCIEGSAADAAAIAYDGELPQGNIQPAALPGQHQIVVEEVLDGEAFYIRFTVKEDAPKGTYPVKLTLVQAINQSKEEVVVQIIDGCIIVE